MLRGVPLSMTSLVVTMFLLSTSAHAANTVRIVLAGDSTVTEKQGWGIGFRELLTRDVELHNLARGGRSSKSFYDEGIWAECLKLKPDYILIQFGHNDEPGKGLARETDAKTTYYENMKRYVAEARSIGAKPVLITSLTRRQFREDGKIHSSLVPYVESVKRVASEENVPLIDLHARSIEYFEKLGAEAWHHLSTKKDDGKWDATHLNPAGSRAVAPLVADELKRAVPELALYLRSMVTVPEGSSIQAAIDAATPNTIIQIAPGRYEQRVRLPKEKSGLTLRGDDASKTIITIRRSARDIDPSTGKEVGTSESYTVLIEASDCVVEGITFENSAGEGAGQAVALRTTGDRNAFRNCRFLGNQDTLYVHQGRCCFKSCYIEGRVDFIFGRSTAVFENCHIHSKNGGYVTASASPPEQPFGLVFLRCKLTGDGKQAYLGRPWKPGAATAFIECELGDHIHPEGWKAWNETDNHKSARYVEYKNTGPGAKTDSRIAWSKQLTDEEAKQYTIENVLGEWRP